MGLGFEGYLTINDMGEQRACHTAIVLRLDGQRWLVDVGLPLLVPLPLGGMRRARSRLQDYEAVAAGEERVRILRAPHPQPEAFQLVNRPVDPAAYRRALTADYGPQGLFLDRVVINKLSGGRLWRFNSAERPFHLESFTRTRTERQDIAGDPAPVIARRFGIDQRTIRDALALVA
jgi:arylamine N-acetyltransferase